MDMQGVSLSATCSMDVKDIGISLYYKKYGCMCIVQCISLHHKQFDVQDVSLHHKQCGRAGAAGCITLHNHQCGLPGCISFHPPAVWVCRMYLFAPPAVVPARCILTTASPVDVIVQGVSILPGNRVDV
jgi:hypothetical protein